MTEDNVAKFIAYYTDVSFKWLLTGEGNMLKEGEKEPNPLSMKEKELYEDKIRLLESNIKDKEKIIALQEQQIIELKKHKHF